MRGVSCPGEACLRGIRAKAGAWARVTGSRRCAHRKKVLGIEASRLIYGGLGRLDFGASEALGKRGLRRAAAPDVRLDAPRCLAEYACIDRFRVKAGAARVMRAGGASEPKLWARVNTPASAFAEEATRRPRDGSRANSRAKHGNRNATSSHRRRSQRAAPSADAQAEGRHPGSHVGIRPNPAARHPSWRE
jgi:hypothetical protein